MRDQQDNLPAKRAGFSLTKPGSLLDEALTKLPKEQQEKLLSKAIEKRLEIDAESMRAEHRYQASSLDMANTVRQIEETERTTNSDYTIKAEYKTASGRTEIEVKKANNTVIIVIAVVIGIVFLLMFSN